MSLNDAPDQAPKHNVASRPENRRRAHASQLSRYGCLRLSGFLGHRDMERYGPVLGTLNASCLRVHSTHARSTSPRQPPACTPSNPSLQPSAATYSTLQLTLRAAFGRRSLLGRVGSDRRGSETLSEAQSTRRSSSSQREKVHARPKPPCTVSLPVYPRSEHILTSPFRPRGWQVALHADGTQLCIPPPSPPPLPLPPHPSPPP